MDLSEYSEKIVQQAGEIAKAMSARVWLVHVAEPDPEFVGWDAGPQSVRDGVADAFREEHRAVQKMADELRGASVDATALLVQGSTVETILQQASNLDANMIIVGSHGRGAAHRLLVGSVGEGVLRKAECPVLVVPSRI